MYLLLLQRKIKKKKRGAVCLWVAYQQLGNITEVKLFALSSSFGIVWFEVEKLQYTTAMHPIHSVFPVHCPC